MSTLPKSGATELVESQASPETAVNEMGRHLDAGFTRAIIEDRDLTAPPGSCSDGACYLIAATATGAWASQDGKLAKAVGTNAANGWLFSTVAVEGFRLYIKDENIEIEHNGSAWAAPSLSNGATASDVWTGTSTAKPITPDAVQDALAPTALTSSTSITPDLNTGMNFTLTLAHNTTLQNPSNIQAGDSGIIEITQDGTGSRTMAYGSNWKFPGGAPVLSTAAGSIDVLAYYAPTTGRILANLTKAYSA
jgi:hypothetical protein